MIILLSILVPSFFAHQFPSYFKALSIYYDSLSEAYFKLPGAKSLFSLIVLLNLSLSSVALFMAMLNNFGADASRAQIFPHNAAGHHSNPHLGENSTPKSPVYLQYDLESYNQSVGRLFDAKSAYMMDLLGFSTLAGSVISGVPMVYSMMDMVAHSLKYSWIVGMPHLMLQNAGFLSFGKNDFALDVENVLRKFDKLKGKRVIFVLPTNGGNFSTLKTSVESVIFWREILKMKYGELAEISQWVVCEQNDYEKNRESYNELNLIGSRIIVVPRGFSTARDTKFKARALTYTLNVMDKEGLVNENVWIYHQDDETKVGEDTMIGIMDYIANAGPNDIYAAGIIIYADGLMNTPPRVQEPARSYDDFRILFTTKTRGMLSFGHHGSHLLVRADIEKDVGWDFGNAKTEDWLFGLMLWQKYKPGKTILKGFGYEKPPLSIDGLLKQRRRWAHGALQILRRKDVRLRYRLAAFYGMISWFSALPSLIAFILAIIHPTGGLFPGSGFIAGFTWYSLYRYYSFGYAINNAYIRSEKGGWLGGRIRKTLAIIGGMILESLAPWYALLKPPKGFEVISKDEGSRRKVANFN